MKRPITSEGHLRRAAFFMLLMLGTELVSLSWRHPLSFYVYVAGGGLFALLAVGSFLRSLISPSAKRGSRQPVAVVEADEEEEAAQVAAR